MDIKGMIEKLKAHPDSESIGMIASHLGIVRRTSLRGKEVMGIDVAYDQSVLEDIIRDIKLLDGIVGVLVDYNEGQLKVGDEILAVAVAGDIRENVFPALIETVNRIKKEATRKREF